MEETTAIDQTPAADEAADARATMSEYIRRIDHAREQITRDQIEIDRMQDETRAILLRLRTLLPAA